ncbi:hypothetical protein V5735_24070 (plasmid) [Haladaptatus sp. SPP-AMP-3]
MSLQLLTISVSAGLEMLDECFERHRLICGLDEMDKDVASVGISQEFEYLVK